MLAAQMRIEEPDEYRELNELAERIYSTWVMGKDLSGTPLPKRPTDLWQVLFSAEAMYHYLEAMSMNKTLGSSETVCDKIGDKLSSWLHELDSFSEERIPDLAHQLMDKLRKDREISGRIHQLAGVECYQALGDLISDFMSQKEEQHG